MRRANELDGAEWTRCSISVWSDIRKTPEETALRHPAIFPTMLVRRVIRCFTPPPGEGGPRVVLDPFCGSGSTLLAARAEGHEGVGVDVAEEYIELARARMGSPPGGADPDGSPGYRLFQCSALRIRELLPAESVDLCVTSPPYWNILARKRSADAKEIRDYQPADEDLSRETDYGRFVERLGEVFDGVYDLLKPGAYCVVNVMDIRKESRFYPLHSDLAARLADPRRGGRFEYDDLILWDRRSEYNNLRPLGYPAVFRINRVHEFLLVFRRPSLPAPPRGGGRRRGGEAGRSG